MTDKPKDDKDPQGGRPDAADDATADTPAPQDPPPPPADPGNLPEPPRRPED